MRIFYTILLPLILYQAGQAVELTCTPDAFPSINGSGFKLAAVREPPVNFALPVGLNKTWVDLDLHGTIAQAIEIIQEAKAERVSLIAFPELYFPGYPVGINTAYTPKHIAQYVTQSMSVDGPEFQQLVHAFREAAMYGSFGFSEIANNSIFMAQALIGPDGSLLIHRRKLRPSGVERDIWSDGDPSGFVVQATPYGRIGMLECWEHFHFCCRFGVDPLAWEDGEESLAAARWYSANMGGTVLMPAVGSAAIYVNGGKTANITNATANPSWRYVTTTIDTTQFSNTTFDIDGEYSWAALKQIIENYPSYIPEVASSFFDKKTNGIQSITSGLVNV